MFRCFRRDRDASQAPAVTLGARRNRDGAGRHLPVFEHSRTLTLLSAGAAGVAPIDSVYVDFRDLEGLERECREGADMGFVGKMAIHPGQVEFVNAAFSPSDAELADVRELLEAFAEHECAGRMTFAFRGEMVDVPHLERARRIVERAEAIARA